MQARCSKRWKINGVEILSPTLFDENIYYGALTDIEVTNNGEEYDVIDVPEIEIMSPVS